MKPRRICAALLLIALLCPLLAAAQSDAALIELPGTHAILLHDNGTSCLIGGASEQAVTAALESLGFYGVDYVIAVCPHSTAAAALAQDYGARYIACQSDDLPNELPMHWEGTALYVQASGMELLFGAEAETDGVIAVRCDGTVLGTLPRSSGKTYMLNLNTKKFHLPGCSSIGQMKDKNKKTYIGDREEIIDQGFVPCKRCNP